MEFEKEFEEWFLSLDHDFTRAEFVKTKSGKYFYSKTKAMYEQFCEIKRLKRFAKFVSDKEGFCLGGCLMIAKRVLDENQMSNQIEHDLKEELHQKIKELNETLGVMRNRGMYSEIQVMEHQNMTEVHATKHFHITKIFKII